MINLEKQFNKRVNKLIGELDKIASKKGSKLTRREARYMALDTIFEDLPDGAYFQAMEDNGYESEDIINISERLNNKGWYKTE